MDHEFTIGHLFAGIGGGAIGTTAAVARFGGHTARFRTLGGVDVDELACRDFERLTGAPALCADVHTLSPAELRTAWGARRPDAVLLSPPCKGFSGLLSAARAAEPKYQKLNRLLLDGLFLLCSTWDEIPPLIFVENVPRITARGADLLRQARELLVRHGYAVTPDAQHNCGEIGGLAQNRMRFFLVARCRARVPQFVYQPPRRRVRGCGEVLGPLPMPGDVAAAGPMHSVPRLSWRNWVRLALIPAGGDWRDLPGVVPPGRGRREVHRRQAVARWEAPAATVTGPGGSAAEHVADPRFTNIMQVNAWDAPARTVIGASRVGSGALSVADPRLASAVGLGRTAEASGSFKGRPGLFGVTGWGEPSPTVTGSAKVSGSNAPASIADPRLTCTPRAGAYRVMAWDEAAATITGSLGVDNGAAAVADPRAEGSALPATPIEPDKAPPFTPVIIAADGTWHRPLTTLELAALQGFPVELGGKPLVLEGSGHTRWREAIGNAIPPPAAEAIGEQLLQALLVSRLGSFALSAQDIWVAPSDEEAVQ